MRKVNLNTAILGTAMLLSCGLSITGYAAQNGWTQENGGWVYYDNGHRVTNEWKKSDRSFWFYLDSDGYMVRNSLVDDRYVNEDGAMVTNSWRKIYENGEDNWYYFTQSGDMAHDGWKTINNKKYHFDSDGTMDYGWFDDNQYHLGGEDDGAMKVGWAHLIGPEDSELEYEENYYYFSSNGVVTRDKMNRKINGYTYAFDDNGRMLHGWVDTVNKVMEDEEGASSDLSNYQYFKPEMLRSGIDGSRMNGWKQIDPPENVDTQADDTPWYYFKDGAPYAATEGKEYIIKSIRSKKYCFNENGEMQYGFQYLPSDLNGTPSNASPTDTDLYYFGKKDEGAMKTGSITLFNEDDGETHNYFFESNGKGYTGLKNDALFFQGKRLDADRDMKYQVASVGEIMRLVNTSGKIQKAPSGKTKDFTDSDGNKFTVDSKGEIVSDIPNGYPILTK